MSTATPFRNKKQKQNREDRHHAGEGAGHLGSALAAQLRVAILNSGESMNAVARRAGIAQPTVSRFMRGERDLTLRTASKLAAVLGIRFTGA